MQSISEMDDESRRVEVAFDPTRHKDPACTNREADGKTGVARPVYFPSKGPSDIRTTLKERGSQHGSFHVQARISQALKRAMRESPNWESLSDEMKESLEMDVHKTARILAGDPMHHDHWHDKVGYITLVADTLAPP